MSMRCGRPCSLSKIAHIVLAATKILPSASSISKSRGEVAASDFLTQVRSKTGSCQEGNLLIISLIFVITQKKPL